MRRPSRSLTGFSRHLASRARNAGAWLALFVSACGGERSGANGGREVRPVDASTGAGGAEGLDAARSGGGAEASDAMQAAGGGSGGTGGVPVLSGTGGIEICAEGGTTPRARTVVTTQQSPFALAADDANVYWVESFADPQDGTPSGNVMKLSMDGVPVTLATNRGEYLGDLALRGTSLYWLSNGTDGHGTVNRVSTAGGTPVELAASASNPTALAVDDAGVYWADAGTLWGGDAGQVEVNYANGDIRKVATTGGAPMLLASGLHNPRAISINGAYVYFVAGGDDVWMAGKPDDGIVARVPLGGGAVTSLATGERCPQDIAIDGTNIYWTSFCYRDDVTGTVRKMSIAGGPATTLASGQRAPHAIAVTPTAVYWANVDFCGSVMSVPLDGGIPTPVWWGSVGALTVAANGVLWTTGDRVMASGGRGQ